MAKPLKEKGIEELRAFQLRVHRQYGLGRIGSDDFKSLHDMTTNLMELVDSIDELDDKADEDGS
jgi:hypothetical protein